ncbi:MAG: hypothetical protein FWF06_07460, partial [Symbiobacteriaceae bacterium]|nr:hypothetical protein [Symbiobacteriaceae bacterium]
MKANNSNQEEAIDLRTYGYTETEAVPAGQLPGRVVDHRGALYKVITARGEVLADITGAFRYSVGEREDYPVVGDYVHVLYNESGNSRITRLLPRHAKFSRADFSGHALGYAKNILEQVVAANFDYVFILTSLNNDFR